MSYEIYDNELLKIIKLIFYCQQCITPLDQVQSACLMRGETYYCMECRNYFKRALVEI